MLITVCVIAYNEENTISNLLMQICNQNYQHSLMEIILVDSASSDRTKDIMVEFAANNQREEFQFYDIKVLTNEKRTLPSGWNVALKEFSGEAILKVDAHATIPQDFVKKNVETLESGEKIAGGLRPNIADESTPWRETLLLAESSMFGSSIAPYRRNQNKTYVKSMFHAAYKREVFENVGEFNENLGRTEDNEIHYRMRQAGFKLCFNPEIISFQHIRSNLRKMIRQKYSNGYWIGLTYGVCPRCLSLYHLIPFVFVVAIILSSILSVCSLLTLPSTWSSFIIVNLTLLMWDMYWTLAVLMAVITIIGAKKKQRNITNLALPFLFFILHISYGIGTLIGFIKMPNWRKGLNSGCNGAN